MDKYTLSNATIIIIIILLEKGKIYGNYNEQS